MQDKSNKEQAIKPVVKELPIVQTSTLKIIGQIPTENTKPKPE